MSFFFPPVLPSCSQELPRIKRPLPSFKHSLHYHDKLRVRFSTLAFVLALLILSVSTQRQNSNLIKTQIQTMSQQNKRTTASLRLAKAAIHHFWNARKFTRQASNIFQDDNDNVRILVDLCRVPPVFVSRLGSEGRRLLLARFTRDSNVLPPWSALPKLLIVDLQNGLGNRLRALASAMEFAYVTDRVLVVLWAPDAHINARMAHLFDQQVVDNLVLIEQPILWPINENDIPSFATRNNRVPPVTRGHPSAASFQYYNLMTKDNDFRTLSDRFVRNSWSKHLYVKTAYLIESSHTRHKLCNVFLQALTPSPRVMQLVHEVEARVGGPHILRGMVGVHLRSRTIVDDNDAVDYECEYSVDGAQITDMWRKMSTPKQFIPEMKRIQREWPDIVRRSSGLEPIRTWSIQSSVALANTNNDPTHITQVDINKLPKFFVCFDSIQTLDELAPHFPVDLVTLPRKCDDRGPECIRYAFADLVLLSRTGAMLASGWSSFSEVALMMRVRRHGVHASSNEGYHVRISGHDFGMPSRSERLLHQIGKVIHRMLRHEHSKRRMTQQAQLEICRKRQGHSTGA